MQDLLLAAGAKKPLKMTVAAAEDEVVLKSVLEAEKLNIIEPILIGNKQKIKKIINKIEFDFDGHIIDTITDEEAAHKAMELIKNGEADFPMKGILSSRIILKAMLD